MFQLIIITVSLIWLPQNSDKISVQAIFAYDDVTVTCCSSADCFVLNPACRFDSISNKNSEIIHWTYVVRTVCVIVMPTIFNLKQKESTNI